MSEAGPERMRRLPPGPHGLPAELVERNQRERLIAAMAEACAERGYVESAVTEVAKRAGVSTASFYRQFTDKRECMLAAFEELFGRLLEAIGAGCADEADAKARAQKAGELASTLLAGDLPTARLLSIEILAVGTEGVLAQHRAIDRLAALLRGVGEEEAQDATWACVAAATALVARRIAEGGRAEPAELRALIERP